MRVRHSAWLLETSSDWSRLIKEFGGGRSQVIDNIVRHLKELGVVSCVLEEPYIDRDYSADFLYYYAKTFREYSRHCKRVHFFLKDITQLLHDNKPSEQILEFRTLIQSNYCGFCVIRPLPTAPIGRTVLSSQMHGQMNSEPTVTCRAQFSTNLLGIDLKVLGTAYLQQDSRVGACAQIAIWIGMRHMHARYGYNWVSVADITRLATPIAPYEAVSLPAGSDFLTSERMLRSISEAGYQPLCFHLPNIDSGILPYVESGIPVVLGLNTGENVGHAVTVVGRVFSRQEHPTNQAINYISAYIVHDDQGGPDMYLPTTPRDNGSQFDFGETTKRQTSTDLIELNFTHANFAIALMSPRVFSTAAIAEMSARDRIFNILDNMPEIREKLTHRAFPINVRLLDELQTAHSEERILLRTYLTSAAGYRRHIIEGSASDELKSELLQLHLPHFTWITEISTTDSFNNSSAGMRRMYGHTIIDATSTAKGRDSLLMLHLPGLLFTRDVSSTKKHKETLTRIQKDDLYECREKQPRSTSLSN